MVQITDSTVNKEAITTTKEKQIHMLAFKVDNRLRLKIS